MLYIFMVVAFIYAIIPPYRMSYWRCASDMGLGVLLLFTIPPLPAWGICLVCLASLALLIQGADSANTLYHSRRDWKLGDRL